MKNALLIKESSLQGERSKILLGKLFFRLTTAFIFDMDGIIIDSERVRLEKINEASQELAPKKPLSKDILLGHLGLTFEEAEKNCKTRFGPDYPYKEIRQLATELEFQYYELSGVPIKKGVMELLELAQQLNVPCAIGTSSKVEIAKLLMQQANLEGFFEFITGGDEVPEGAGKKEIFLRVAKLIGIHISLCTIFEDSPKGLKGAIECGGVPICIADLVTPDEVLLKSSFQFENLYEFAKLFRKIRKA